jgi:hypothetical protein
MKSAGVTSLANNYPSCFQPNKRWENPSTPNPLPDQRATSSSRPPFKIVLDL